MNLKNNSYFLTRYTYDFRRSVFWKVLCDYLQKKYISIDSTVVDIGAGYCDFINNIKAKEKYAVDKTEVILKYAKEDVITHIGDCQNLSFLKSDFFDIVFSSNLLEHLSKEEIDKTLDEFVRILKPSGKIILILPNFRYCYKFFYDDYTHLTPLTDVSIKDIFICKNINNVRVFPKFLPFSFKSRIPVNRFLVSLYLVSPFKPFAGQMLVIATKE